MNKHEPISYTVESASIVSGIGRTRLFGFIASGDLQVARIGRRTLIIAQSLRDFVSRHEQRPSAKEEPQFDECSLGDGSR